MIVILIQGGAIWSVWDDFSKGAPIGFGVALLASYGALAGVHFALLFAAGKEPSNG